MSADVDEAQHARMHNPEQLEFGKRQRWNSRSPPGGSDATVDADEAAKNAVLTMLNVVRTYPAEAVVCENFSALPAPGSESKIAKSGCCLTSVSICLS